MRAAGADTDRMPMGLSWNARWSGRLPMGAVPHIGGGNGRERVGSGVPSIGRLEETGGRRAAGSGGENGAGRGAMGEH